MDGMWGAWVVKLRTNDAKRGQLFDDGNFAMFIYWWLYAQLATWGVDPEYEQKFQPNLRLPKEPGNHSRYMEKFGEWKDTIHVHSWEADGKGSASWEIDVVEPGDYNVELTYAGEGRLVWSVGIEGGEQIRNQQNSSHKYQKLPNGCGNFPKLGRYRVNVSWVEGDATKANLKSIQFVPAR